MENDLRSNRRYMWRLSLLFVGVVVALVLALNIADIVGSHSQSSTVSGDPDGKILRGDFYARYALAARQLKLNPKSSAQSAIDYYQQACPLPAAYRRIGIIRRVILDKSPLPDLTRIDSRQATKGMTAHQTMLLKDEANTWRRAYGTTGLTESEAARFISRIKKLDIGPLKWAAIAEVYAGARQAKKANSALARARNEAYRLVTLAGAIMAVLLVAGIAGIGLGISFMVRHFNELRDSPQPQVDSSALMMGFVSFLLGIVIITQLTQIVLDVSGIRASENPGSPVDLFAQIAITLAAFAISMAITLGVARRSGWSAEVIGLGRTRIWRAVRLGVGGYCVALPLMGVMIIISNSLQNTIFRGVQTPIHPIVSYVTQGGAAFWAAFILGVVIAPIVEEIVFRGMLYTALRDQMRVWPAVILSGTFFAIVHPTLPAGFLPILALAVVLAILREKTGSVVPGMVCHALNNALMLALTRLVY